MDLSLKLTKPQIKALNIAIRLDVERLEKVAEHWGSKDEFQYEFTLQVKRLKNIQKQIQEQS